MSEWLWLAPAALPVCGLLRWLALLHYGRWLLKNSDDQSRAMKQVETLAQSMQVKAMLPSRSTEGN